MDTTCDLCGDPVRDTAYVCPRCTRDAAGYLAQVVKVAGEVETTVARLARYSERPRRGQLDEDPGDDAETQVRLPVTAHGWPASRIAPEKNGLRSTSLSFDPAARDRGNRASNDIVTWARHVAETRGGGPLRPQAMIGPLCRAGAGCRHDSCAVIRWRTIPPGVARAAAYLLDNLEWLRYRREAEEALPQLAAAGAVIVRIVDAPPPMWYAGPCWADVDAGRCPEELYARNDDGTVRCPACGGQHDVSRRRQWLLTEADGVLAHAALIAAALSVLDQRVTASMVRNYADRGRIVAHGVDQFGRPLYRVGEVRRALAQLARRRVDRVAA